MLRREFIQWSVLSLGMLGCRRHYEQGRHPDDQLIPAAAGAEETNGAEDGGNATPI